MRVPISVMIRSVMSSTQPEYASLRATLPAVSASAMRAFFALPSPRGLPSASTLLRKATTMWPTLTWPGYARLVTLRWEADTSCHALNPSTRATSFPIAWSHPSGPVKSGRLAASGTLVGVVGDDVSITHAVAVSMSSVAESTPSLASPWAPSASIAALHARAPSKYG